MFLVYVECHNKYWPHFNLFYDLWRVFEFMINIIKYIFVDLNINFEFWRWNFMLLFGLLLYFNILFKYTYVLLGYTVLVWRSGKGQDISHLFIINSSVILGRGECISYQGWSLSSHHLTYKKVFSFSAFVLFLFKILKNQLKGRQPTGLSVGK